jgi:hypothetical protein
MMVASWSKMLKRQQIMMRAPLQHHIQQKTKRKEELASTDRLNEAMVTYFKHKSSVASASSSQTEGASPMQLFLRSIGKTCDEQLNVNQQLQFQITILSELQKLINKN